MVLCANTLVDQQDFSNAMKRALIRLYDYQRSENYDFDNCKHLACTEVRSAQFDSTCNPREKTGSRLSKLSGSKIAREKIDANEFCMKDLATRHLTERDKCAEKAERYVNYIFERCKSDTAPFSGGSRQRKVKTLTDIL